MGKIKVAYHDEIEKSMRDTRWFRANNKSDKMKGATVDRENGAIYGVSVCTEGEALGHDVWLDNAFIADVVSLGKAVKKGVKARFGHPNMSGEALGTYIGRFMNFRQEGTKAVADLYFDDSAKVSPNGDLVDYLMTLAETSPDVFGASIVFSIKDYFFKKTKGENISTRDHYENQDKESVDYQLELDDSGYNKYFISIKELYGADLVDEPAANEDGLFSQFSSTQLHADKFAVIATEFLNQYPAIAAFVKKNPHKITEFMKKFDANNLPLEEDEVVEVVPPVPNEAVETDPAQIDEEGLFTRFQTRLSKVFKAYDDKLTALAKRVTDLEENPNADPTFSARKKDNESVKERKTYSWDAEADKRRKS